MVTYKLVEVNQELNGVILQRAVTNKLASRTMRIGVAASPDLIALAMQFVGQDVEAELVKNDVPCPGMRLVKLQPPSQAA